MTLRHGFKAEAERIASDQRELLGLAPADPVNPFLLLRQHNITVRTPSQVDDLSPLESESLAALVEHFSAWSAVTLRTPNGVLVVHNPLHEIRRQHSNLTHELAHVLLRHRPGALQTVYGCVMRDFDEIQEEEAACLGDTILAPRIALATAARRKRTVAQTAHWLGASEQLVRYRVQITGVNRQYRSFAS